MNLSRVIVSEPVATTPRVISRRVCVREGFAADNKRGELLKKYYEFTTVHHFGASEYSARFA